MTIGERIRQRRTELKLSQEALARLVGVTRSAVSQMESGKTKDPRPHHLVRYARALGMETDRLVEGGVRAGDRAAVQYGTLSPAERVLVDYIRANGVDDAEREHLARVALQLLLAAGTRPVNDERLSPQWNASNKHRR